MYMGELIVFLLIKNSNDYKLFPTDGKLYFYEDGDMFYGRVGLQETL